MENNVKLFFLTSMIAIVLLMFLLVVFLITYHSKMLQSQKDTFNQIIDATEIETQRIGQNLHDDLGPLLASVKLTISGTLLGAGLDTKYFEMLEHGKTYLTQAINTIRDQSHLLIAANFDQLSLFEVLQSRVDSVNLTEEWKGEILGLNNDLIFEHTAKLMVFRICNELIYNSIKHSDGNIFQIQFENLENSLHMQYTDNGTKKIQSSNLDGIGINGIKSRIKYLSGTMKIHDQKGFKADFTFSKSTILI
jgi:signal transduction histidine kinase